MNILFAHRFNHLENNINAFSFSTSIKRFKSEDSYLDYLYRFMWYLPEQDMIIYDPSLYQYEPKTELRDGQTKEGAYDSDFSYESSVTLDLSFSGKMRYFKTPKCLNPPKYSVTVCQITLNENAINLDQVYIQPQYDFITEKFPTKSCRGKYFIHPFQACDGSSEISEMNLPLYKCLNGLYVHYTVTCNGFDDCQDSSDEQYCYVYDEFDLLGENNLFKCENSHQVEYSLDFIVNFIQRIMILRDIISCIL